jgi:iron complex outermembrane receptor protein
MNRNIAVIPYCFSIVISAPLLAEDENPKELEAMVVTAQPEAKQSSIVRPAADLRGDKLRIQAGNTLGDTLGREPGITSSSFGPGVGLPVIRGQTGPRVRILQDAVGNLDVSSLSPDHANSIEPTLAERIEVLRGPATLLYGSGAIGGVVNVTDNRIPRQVPENLLTGALEQRYSSVSNEPVSVLKFDGGRGLFAWHADGFYRDRDQVAIRGFAIDRSAEALLGNVTASRRKGFIPNSDARAKGGSVGFSAVDDWGFAGVSVNRLENDYGIPPTGNGEENVRIDLEQTRYDFKSELYDPVDSVEILRLRLGYNDYRHVEVEDGAAGTLFRNRGAEGRVELVHRPLGPVHGIVGAQVQDTEFSALGEEAVVPRSAIQSYGFFALENYDREDWAYQVGLRLENATVAPEQRKSRSFTPVSASAAASWKVDETHSFSLAVTRSQRVPQVQELFSNGVHAATRSFERGDETLTEETSYNLDLGYQLAADGFTATVDLFHNWIAHYIFQRRTGEWFDEAAESFVASCPAGVSCLPVLQSRQQDATFKGFEATLGIPLLRTAAYGELRLTLFGDYTRGTLDGSGDVPRMPPLRYGVQLDYGHDRFAANVRLSRGEDQDKPGAHETATPGYLLLNIGVQYSLSALKKDDLLLFLKGNNLLDDPIRNSTSYLRNFAPEPGRGVELGLKASF